MTDALGISEVKAKFAAICDRAAGGEVIEFTRRRGSRVERFELRRIESGKRRLGSWRGRLTDADIDRLGAPLSDQEQADWDI